MLHSFRVARVTVWADHGVRIVVVYLSRPQRRKGIPAQPQLDAYSQSFLVVPAILLRKSILLIDI